MKKLGLNLDNWALVKLDHRNSKLKKIIKISSVEMVFEAKSRATL
jgi:hypothetical protein